MTTRERIGTAQESSDLGEVHTDEIGDVDIIRACGMAGVSNALGLSIWRWRVARDNRELRPIFEGLVALGHPQETVIEVLTHMSNDVCQQCAGRGYFVIPGTPMLSDDVCPECRGAGRRTMTGAQELVVVELIEQFQRQVAGEIMRRLNTEMDL